MQSLFTIRQIRHTAFVMLIVWLLTLGIGLANACLVVPGADRLSPTGPVASAVHRDVDDHAASVDKATCISFCAAEQTTLVKGSSQWELAACLGLLAALFFTGIIVPMADPAAHQRVACVPTWLEPPVSIRFLRLII